MSLKSYELRKNRSSENFTCFRTTGILPTLSTFFVYFAYTMVQKMYTNLYQVSEQGFHENRHRGGPRVLTVVTEIKCACTVKPIDVYKVKNASVKCVCRHGIQHFQYSC